MATSVTWNNTSYSIPAAGELNWSTLSDFLIALGGGAGQPGAQVSGKVQKFGMRVATAAGDVTVSDINDCVIVVNKTVGAATNVLLPAGVTGRIFMVVDGKGDAASNNITIDPDGAQTIMGGSTYVMNVNKSAVLIGYDGSDWKIIGAYEGASIPDSRLATISTAGKVSNSATTATNANTASAIVARDASGNFSAGTITATLSGSATNFSGSLSGDVTGTQSATAISATTVTGKALTGFVSGAGSVSATDTILQAFNKIDGNVAGKEPTITTLAASKGGLGTNASAFTGVVKASAGTFSAATIGDADVSASAAIAHSKLANITAGRVLLGNASNVPTATALTGDVTVTSSGVTAIAANVIVNNDVSASASISGSKINPDFGAQNIVTTGSVSGTNVINAGYEEFSEIASPSAPAAGKIRVYAKTDGKMYQKDDAGNEKAIGSGSGSGGVNYLVDWYDATKTVGTVSTVAAGGNVTVSGSFPDVSSAWYADATSGATVTAGSFVVGKTYVISSVGTTDFTLIGAASNTVGVTFTATGVGTGTGQAVSSAAFVSTDNTLRGTTNLLTQLSGASTSGATFVQSPVFNIDGEDLGKSLTVQFDISGNTTDDDWDVVAVRYNSSGTFQELIPIAGNVSSMTGTPSAKLPLGVKQFNGFFITGSTASDVYAIRWRRRNGSVAIRLDSLTVGPNQVLQGAIVTDWQDYTPSFTGFGTATSVNFKYARRGDTLHIQGRFLGGTSTATQAQITLPTGLTIGSASTIVVGGWIRDNSTANTNKSGVVLATAGNNYLQLSSDSYAGSASPFGPANGSSLTSGETVGLFAEVKIAEWQSNTQMAARAVEEYASNDTSGGTTNGTYNTGMAYGPAGSIFPNSATAVTANETASYKVSWTTPILKTDAFAIEVSADSGTTWGPGQGICLMGRNIQSNATYGMWWDSNDATSIYVRFGLGGRLATAGFGLAGSAWSGISGSTYRWRVRKVSGNAAVGYPVGARNVIGDTTGTSVPAGYVGQELVANNTNNSISTASFQQITSLTLTTGVWLVSGTADMDGTAGCTGLAAKFYTKGVAGSQRGKDLLYLTGLSSAATVFATFPQRVVVVADSDSDKSVSIYGQSYGATSKAYSTIVAVRIA